MIGDILAAILALVLIAFGALFMYVPWCPASLRPFWPTVIVTFAGLALIASGVGVWVHG